MCIPEKEIELMDIRRNLDQMTDFFVIECKDPWLFLGIVVIVAISGWFDGNNCLVFFVIDECISTHDILGVRWR